MEGQGAARHITLFLPHLPDLDKLAAATDGHHVAVVRHPDLVHVLVVVLVASPVPSRPHLYVGHQVEGGASLPDIEQRHLALTVTKYHVRVPCSYGNIFIIRSVAKYCLFLLNIKIKSYVIIFLQSCCFVDFHFC